MAEYPTVTISADEYFDLRSKAETNLFLTTQLSELQNRMFNLENRFYAVESKVIGNG